MSMLIPSGLPSLRILPPIRKSTSLNRCFCFFSTSHPHARLGFPLPNPSAAEGRRQGVAVLSLIYPFLVLALGGRISARHLVMLSLTNG